MSSTSAATEPAFHHKFALVIGAVKTPILDRQIAKVGQLNSIRTPAGRHPRQSRVDVADRSTKPVTGSEIDAVDSGVSESSRCLALRTVSPMGWMVRRKGRCPCGRDCGLRGGTGGAARLGADRDLRATAWSRARAGDQNKQVARPATAARRVPVNAVHRHASAALPVPDSREINARKHIRRKAREYSRASGESATPVEVRGSLIGLNSAV